MPHFAKANAAKTVSVATVGLNGTYRGALRRRIRRLALRDFNNVRTASFNRDLAIRAPNLIPAPPTCMDGFGPVYGGHNGGLFLASAGPPGGFHSVKQ
jgi:hypothetical protein